MTSSGPLETICALLQAKLLISIHNVWIISKFKASLTRNYIQQPSSAPRHTLPKLYDNPVGFVTTSFEAVYCFT